MPLTHQADARKSGTVSRRPSLARRGGDIAPVQSSVDDRSPSVTTFMRRELLTLRADMPVIAAIDRLLHANVSGAPVVDADGCYLGVLSEKASMNALSHFIAESGDRRGERSLVRDFMTRQLWTIAPTVEVFDAIETLLRRHISGAPVLDHRNRYLGVFSEKTAMRALVSALYEWIPGAAVDQYVNTDLRRIIDDQDSLEAISHKFQTTPYRRLPIVRDGQLLGQVSRRDVLRAQHRLVRELSGVAAEQKSWQQKFGDDLLVGRWMDTDAMVASPSTDMLAIAQMFLQSPYRRLPVIESVSWANDRCPIGGRLVGQVSRRDLLEAAVTTLRPQPQKRIAETLYLSGDDARRRPNFAK